MPTSHSTCCEGYGIGLNETGELICFGCGSPVIKPPKDGPILHGLIQKAGITADNQRRDLFFGSDGKLWMMSPPGCRPKRDAYIGLHHVEPALAMICVGCELEQAPLTHGERTCAYCGLRLKLFGSRVFWWREPGPAVEEWRP